MYVIATAGHVDHGKSTLVRALTGIEPDRWAEERRRGMTIDLGFAWTTLPSGRRLAFVDVPGHERFVTNMLAGLGPVPAVMFVLAADQGWQAQSQEHWEAIKALGVDRGLLVVTRCDLMDPALAVEEARERIPWPVVTVSGSTGEGLDDLRLGLDRLVASLPPPDPRAPVRLWIDRAFTITGAGTVVTGTLAAGTLRSDDTLVLGGERVRVKALQVMGEPATEVTATARVAVNLRGVERDRAVRGETLLTPDAWIETDVVDARLDVRMDPQRGEDIHPRARSHGSANQLGPVPREAVLHIGSASVPVRIRPMSPGAPLPSGTTGAIATARLTLARPLPLRIGDRALLRCPGRPITSVLVLDVRPPALRRRGAGARRAAELAPFAGPEVTGVPDAATVLGWRGVVRRSELVAMGCDPGVLDVPGVGDWVVDPARWASLVVRLKEVVAEHPGISEDAARTALGLPTRDLVEALVKTCPPLRLSEGRIDGGGVPGEVVSAVERLRAELAETPYLAPEAARLPELGLSKRTVALAVRAGMVLRLTDGVVLLPGADTEAARILAKLPQPFTAGDARAALGTNRRVIIPLLEHLDRLRLTRRIDDRLRVVVDQHAADPQEAGPHTTGPHEASSHRAGPHRAGPRGAAP
ncbi:selenocysteine-specific translation elongation factor [Nonomuraea sp. SYSU D8015]|uniref:selenocysteine-specific translation elongation factor n=1 Tax=Nonomuraea sp. SYSU D8015 TaxID=2593644 RepID=UPI001660998F|nr:selenocysteine-specific translation elongation factor [Nonomuraea sp. SYSU D8015]